MKKNPLSPLALLSLFLVPLGLLAQVEPPPGEAVPFETIDRGDASGFRYGDPAFLGGEFHITDAATWERFWRRHTAGQSPPAPLPEIKFPQEHVIAVLLGYQTSGGGPSIRISGIRAIGRETRVFVAEDRTPGPLDGITNPYHFVRIPRLRRSLSFDHHRRMAEVCMRNEDCGPEEVCDLRDPTCGESGAVGPCVTRPDVCVEIYDPVCGCDGVTYPNDCYRLAAGAVLWHEGICF